MLIELHFEPPSHMAHEYPAGIPALINTSNIVRISPADRFHDTIFNTNVVVSYRCYESSYHVCESYDTILEQIYKGGVDSCDTCDIRDIKDI